MRDTRPDPEVITYQSAVAGAKVRRAAAFMILSWSSVMILAGLPFAVGSVLSILSLSQVEVFLGIGFTTIMGLMAYLCVTGGISLIRVAQRLFGSEAINVESMIETTRLIEMGAYVAGAFVAGCAIASLSVLGSGWFVAAVAIPIFMIAGTLTYTRIVLRRVRRAQAEHESA